MQSSSHWIFSKGQRIYDDIIAKYFFNDIKWFISYDDDSSNTTNRTAPADYQRKKYTNDIY